MESTQPQLISTSELVPVHGNGATPFAQQTVVLTKQDDIELTWKAHYWQAHYERLLAREAALKADVAAHEATIRDLTQRRSGTKSEQSSGSDRTGESTPASPRNRGQQPGRKGHGRSDRSALPVVAAAHDWSAAAKHCPACGEAFLPFPGTEDSSIIDVQVQAHRRRIQRARPEGGSMPAGLGPSHGAAGAATDPEKPVGGVGMDDGVAGHIPLWPSDPPRL